MTESSAPPYAAQLILSIPGQTDSATITVTLLPNDTIPVDGQKKALADCTLRELRTFANTLEADIWQTYDEISLLDMTSAKDVAILVSRLDKHGKAADTLDNWADSIVLFPSSKPAAKVERTKAAAEKPAESPKTAITPATTKAPAVKPKPAKADTESEKSDAPPAKSKPEPGPAKQPPPEPEAEPSTVTKTDDVDEVAATISFPAPVKPKDIEDARPKIAERPHIPATIEPSEARVRVAGKRLAPGTATWAAVDLLMDEPPLRAMQAHALSSLDREVAGVMVGPRPEKQPDGRYLVRVIDSIAAKYTVMQGASVTYTADSWRYLNDTLGERYPDETGVMIGWYHTHPGFGIFLSGMDLFIHQNFFTQIWHTAYVLDPRAHTSGFFCWSRDKTRVNRYDFVWPDWAEGSW